MNRTPEPHRRGSWSTQTTGLVWVQVLGVTLTLLVAVGVAPTGSAQVSFQSPAKVPVQGRPEKLEGVGFDQRLDQQLPLDTLFTDTLGVERPLGSFLAGRPVIVAPVYYDCPMLCTMVLNGLMRAVRSIEPKVGTDFDVIVYSIDPKEGHELAAEKRRVYVNTYRHPGSEPGWHFLTGTEASIRTLSDAIGFHFRYDEETKEFAHASGVVLVTPTGKIARYFFGIDYNPTALRLSLVEANEGKVGSPVEQLLLFCFHYDPTTGRYSVAILNILRAVAIMTAVGLAGYILMSLWRDRRAARDSAPLRRGH